MPHCKRIILSIGAMSLIALNALAANPPRRHSAAPTYNVKITGVVTDATTGKPIVAAEVSIVNSRTKVNTDSEGKFTINAQGGYSVGVQATRTGYSTAVKTLPGAADASTSFQLTPTATTTVRDTAGNTTTIDTESFKFAYLIPFSGYSSSDQANFCLASGDKIQPDRSEVSKLIGPATPQNVSACCNIGPIMSMQAVFKDGTTKTVYFVDSCFGNEVDVLGREHNTGQFVYFNLANVAEVNLP